MSAFKRAWQALWKRPSGDIETALKATESLPPNFFGKKRATAKQLPAVGKKRVIKIALDQSIGKDKKRRLEKMGYEVVVVADHGEPDDQWLDRAFDAGALFVVSPDLDIPNLIEREGYYMIWIDYLHGQKGLQAEYIHKRIQEKIKFLEDPFKEKV